MSAYDFHLGSAPTPSPAGPLEGVAVLITRPALQAARSASRLAALGAVPIVYPTQVIEPPSDPAPLAAARQRLAEFHAAIFVSPSAVEMTLAPYGDKPLAVPAGLDCYAPGPGTAEALSAAGVERVLMPAERFDSEGLLELETLAAEAIRGRRIVVFRGEQGRELLPDTLRERGAVVEVVAAYRSRPPSTPATGLVNLLEQEQITAISAMSSEALGNLLKLVEAPAALSKLLALPVYASHPRIAETARGLGFAQVIECGAGDAGLIAALLMRHEA